MIWRCTFNQIDRFPVGVLINIYRNEWYSSVWWQHISDTTIWHLQCVAVFDKTVCYNTYKVCIFISVYICFELSCISIDFTLAYTRISGIVHCHWLFKLRHPKEKKHLSKIAPAIKNKIKNRTDLSSIETLYQFPQFSFNLTKKWN